MLLPDTSDAPGAAGIAAWLGIVGTIAGTVVGALLAYFFSYRLEKIKALELVQRIEGLLFVEMWGHQASLARTLDGLLPQWLRRGERPIHHIIPFTPPLSGVVFPTLTTEYFDKFFEHLVHSPRLLQFADYNRRVRGLNADIDYLAKGPEGAESIKEDCVRTCALLLSGSISIMNGLLETSGFANRLGPQHQAAIDSFRANQRWYQLIAAVTKYDLPELLDWREVARSAGIKVLPAPFNDDPDKTWENYLNAALASNEPKVARP